MADFIPTVTRDSNGFLTLDLPTNQRGETMVAREVMVQMVDDLNRLGAEVERLRGWIDALEPRQSFEATLCPMCHAATEYKYWANVEQHKDGCPWREAARQEDRRG